MKMLEAYAHQVVSYHPAAQRDELFAEIYDELCEEFSDRQAQESALSEIGFLKKYKQHPMRYATQLAAGSGSYLIGPQFYFSYLSTIKVAVTVVVLFHLAFGAFSALTSGETLNVFWRTLLIIPHTLLWVVVAVTGVFAALERSGEKASWLDDWDAESLKPINDHQMVSRWESSLDLGLSTFGLLLVLDVVEFPIMFNNGPDWIQKWTVNVPDGFWLATGFLFALGIGFSLYCLYRTFWTPRMRAMVIIKNILWIILLTVALNHAELLSLESHAMSELTPLLEKVARGILLGVCLIIGWDTAVQIRHLIKRKKVQAQSPGA